MQSIRDYPLLDRETEQALAKRFAKDGDAEAFQRLMTGNLRLVVKIARQYGKAHRDLIDLIQEGNLGLAQAIRHYDLKKGVKLSTYAMWWIRAYVLKAILDNARLVRVGKTETERKLFFNLRKAQDKLAARGIEPTTARLSKILKAPEKDVAAMSGRLRHGDLSLDAPIGYDDDAHAPLDFLAANDATPAEIAEGHEWNGQMHERLTEFGATLGDRDRAIFERRWMAEEPLTLNQIGKQYGISRERARQVEKKLLKRLRSFLETDAPMAMAA